MVCYILQTVLLVIILLFTTAIICYHFANIGQNWKTYWLANNIQMQNNKKKFEKSFEKVRIKNRTCCYFDDITKFKNFDSGLFG